MVLPVRPAASSSARNPTLCGPFDSICRPSLAMTRFSPTSGTTSASVPIAAILTNAGSHCRLARLAAERLHQLQRDADAGEVLVRVGAVVALRIDDGAAHPAARCRARGGR